MAIPILFLIGFAAVFVADDRPASIIDSRSNGSAANSNDVVFKPATRQYVNQTEGGVGSHSLDSEFGELSLSF